ncbi:NUDIX domain-containing protein [Alterisphingorhabdus coralli]|uniref:NUDIX domain-containing protein n=1 Tax=Alterisphingorhabdus coralli TaxID=3071408 RepID=A0AA97F4Z7_9SPHN|nr:NUDIX domain-containing protein [Parasphingorhabdus sp. SCSIO 66989]WOE74429.1 NUDIX domain-containing protein [Parasphingorhabdus sp. SCSIO 66989]
MHPIHLLYRLAQTVRGVYWRVVRPKVYGAKLLVRNRQSEVLLIRHSYGRSDLYMLPGGGIKRGETALDAARRELREEVGCRAEELALLGKYLDTSKGARNHVSVFTATTHDQPQIDGREIVEATFFPVTDLPANASTASRRRVAEMLGEAEIDGRW